jgi:hypothetical protein
MKILLSLFPLVHGVIALVFVLISLVLVAIGLNTGWLALADGLTHDASVGLIESIGLIAVAVVALQIGQTILEEEVVREAHVSAPTRVRRFLSRFMVVVVVALAIEGLVAVFQALHENNDRLPQAASVVVAVGILLAGWGIFVKLNRAAEELEPEAMEQAKSEDAKLE